MGESGEGKAIASPYSPLTEIDRALFTPKRNAIAPSRASHDRVPFTSTYKEMSKLLSLKPGFSDI